MRILATLMLITMLSMSAFAKNTKTITVVIQSYPSNASIFMNKTFRGQTPLAYKVKVPNTMMNWCGDFPLFTMQWQSGVVANESPRVCFAKGKVNIFVRRPEGPLLDVDMLAAQIQALDAIPTVAAVPIVPIRPPTTTIINVQPPPRSTGGYCMINGNYVWCF